MAYQACKGPVSDFLKRHFNANPTHTWYMGRGRNKERVDLYICRGQQYALSLLRKVKQREWECIQVYAERIIALADAFDDVIAANEQLIGFYIDEPINDFMKMKIMCDNTSTCTLSKAIEIANAEQNLRRQFNLRAGNHSQAFHAAGPEPMEIDRAQLSLCCYNCKKQGHRAKDYPLCKASVNLVNQTRNLVRPRPCSDIVYWNCR